MVRNSRLKTRALIKKPMQYVTPPTGSRVGRWSSLSSNNFGYDCAFEGRSRFISSDPDILLVRARLMCKFMSIWKPSREIPSEQSFTRSRLHGDGGWLRGTELSFRVGSRVAPLNPRDFVGAVAPRAALLRSLPRDMLRGAPVFLLLFERTLFLVVCVVNRPCCSFI